MRLQPLPALRDNYIWLLTDDHGHAVVVDPGEAGPVQDTLDREGLHLQAILLTHHHDDHIGGAAELARRHRAVTYAPVDERIEHADHRVGDDDAVVLERPALQFTVMAIPGHTRSHIAYHGHGMLFCGDTLFSLGCGRLFEGTPAQMLASLDRLCALPGDTLVCCAHEYTQANAAFARTVTPDNRALMRRSEEVDRLRAGNAPTLPSRLAEECACNPFLRVEAEDAGDWMARHGLAADASRVQRFAALRAAKDHFQA